jgi:protein-disulfide isomerase
MENSQNFSIPMSIVAAGFIIAVAVVAAGALTKGDGGSSANNLPPAEANVKVAVNPKIDITLSNDDHVRGNSDARVTIVEFSDFSCPYCSSFHPTVKQIVEDYDGDVNWIFKHFPLSSIHPVAKNQAIASECSWEQGGDDAFWAFSDGIFEGENDLNALALEIGLDGEDFDTCLSEERYADKVEQHYQEAITAGGSGTPYSIVVGPNGETKPLSGALPYSSVAAVIDEMLN